MLIKRLCLLAAVGVISATAVAETVTDKLVIAVADANLPPLLYEEKDQRWELGTYNLIINRNGGVGFSTTSKDVAISLPIEVLIDGKLEQELFGNKILVNCSSRVLTEGALRVVPELSESGSTADVSIDIPVPESMLNCDGLQVPITLLLQQIVEQHRAEWEARLESDIKDTFKQLGI